MVGEAFCAVEVVVKGREAEACSEICAHAWEGRLGCFDYAGAATSARGSGEQQHRLSAPELLIDPRGPVVEVFEGGGVGAVVLCEGNDDGVVGADQFEELFGGGGNAVGVFLVSRVNWELETSKVEVGDAAHRDE